MNSPAPEPSRSRENPNERITNRHQRTVECVACRSSQILTCGMMLSLIILVWPGYGRTQTTGRGAKTSATFADEPLPDINSLLAEVQGNQRAIDEIRENYTYDKLEEEMELDGRGQIKKKHARELEVSYINGHEIQKLIARDGRGLSGAAREKEQRRVDKELSRYTSADPRPVSRREEEDEDELHISTFLRAAKFTHPRRESFRGQDVIVLDIEPNPSYHPQSLNERLVQKLEGVMWIDQHAHQVVRLEAHLGSTAKMGGGLLGSIAQGSAAVFEQSLVNNEVWLPSYLEEHLSGRFLLFSRYRRDFVIHYKDYKKFRVEVHSEIGSPKPNQ